MNTALIVAAGSGSRMKSDKNKQLVELKGVPVIVRTLLAFENNAYIDNIITVARSEDIDVFKSLIEEYGIKKVSDVVPGGDCRRESVACGLELVGDDDIVLIHDGARPLISGETISKIIEALGDNRAAACGVRVKDTIKVVDPDNIIVSTPDRDKLIAIQTPQAFRAADIKRLHAKARRDNIDVTDDCALAEADGIKVKVITGDYRNIKITTPEDIKLAEAYLCE